MLSLPTGRDSWRKYASQGRRYSVSWPVRRAIFPGSNNLPRRELHWHKTAEVRWESDAGLSVESTDIIPVGLCHQGKAHHSLP